MEETYLLNLPGIRKKILAGGTAALPHFAPGTKLVFHFQTLLDNFERTIVDDSRLAGRPAEIFFGKMFKMEVWETLLGSMRVGEVAEFWCDAIHTGLYPIVSKGMRLIAQGKDPLEGQRHMCGMGNMFHYHSTGFPELDELMRTPQPLIFIMELLQVGDPMSYQRESWMMEKDEKLQTVPIVHMQGNLLVKQRKYREAASKYKEAVLLLKTVQSREMPGDIDYTNLGRMIIPLELNYCQCMLELEEYYEVIEHTTELLEKHKDCVKGYYKRAKAHAAVWNEKEARRDFNMVAHLDITLASLIGRELKALSESMKEKYWEEKEQYWNMLEKKENSNKEEEGRDEDEEEEEEGDDGKQEDGESVTTQSEDEVGEEEGKAASPRILCAEGHEEEPEGNKVTPTEGGDREEASSSEINPNAATKAEGKDWQQMLRLVMFLQNEGNFLIKENQYQEASEKFKEALEYVDTLQNMVDRPGEDWDSLEKVRLPLTLNLSQCLLELKHYQQVVELNDKLLKKHKGNFKAVYQRAKAHAALCNKDKARRDFDMVEKLDPTFKPFVRQELRKLSERVRIMHVSQNKTYRETTREKWGPGGTAQRVQQGRKTSNVHREPVKKTLK
ncbi:Aryl-hydrocarbon-interacting protein-like 1 [Liparis tanakae]|uniref:Aryl-hydrocarbon-interacting protein-like 1 n=1 Tax=Liparis tanakae TaxID=230148 RepID=A0A4Z2I3U1_9TELE|nr:Aryl-hydrocarbon-interacting protein-like 1 [Liparis tanakae]